LEAAYDLLAYAEKIYVMEYSDSFKGDEILQDKLKQNPKVEFITNAETKEIKGSSLVEKIIYQDRVSGEQKELDVGGVFVNIGQVPNTGFLEGFLELSENKEIKINAATGETSVEGVFAAGDVTDSKNKQYVIAAGQGANALLNAYDYLKRRN